jgi:hypothetical protein
MRIFFIIMSFIVLSCKKQNKFEKNITTESNNCYWTRKAKGNNGNYLYFNSQIVFFNNYKMMSFLSDDENKLGSRSIINIEGSNEEKWSYNEKDSIFQICAVCIFKVDKYSRDTIFMTNKYNDEKFVLIRKYK